MKRREERGEGRILYERSEDGWRVVTFYFINFYRVLKLFIALLLLSLVS